MASINILNPSSRKRAIKCGRCGLMYRPSEYDILFKNKKLIYFKYKAPKTRSKIYCNECILYEVAKNNNSLTEPIKLIVKHGKNEYDCDFFPSELDENEGGFPLDEFF